MNQAQPTLDEAQPSSLQFLIPVGVLILDGWLAASGASSLTVWYIIRASGVVAYLVLAVSVISGQMISGKMITGVRPRELYEVHSFSSLLVLCIASFHALALLFDKYIGFSPTQVLLPLTSTYRPVGVSLGILGLYLGMAIYASFWIRKRIGYRTWRTLHFGSFATFALVTAHGLVSGADISRLWLILIYLVAVVAVLGLLLVQSTSSQS